MATIVKLRVRPTPNSNWVENFSNLGWQVRDINDRRWIQMTPQNTKVRSADNTAWLPVK